MMDIEVNNKKYELIKDSSGNYIIPDNAAGTYVSGDIEVTYYYAIKKIPLIVKHYIEGTEIEVPLADGTSAENVLTEGNEGDSYTTSLGMLEAHSLASLGIESTPMTSDYMNVVVIQTIEITLWTDENPNEKISATVTFTNDVDGIEETVIDNLVDVYTLQGVIVKRQISVKDLETELPSGIYIVGGKKFVVK